MLSGKCWPRDRIINWTIGILRAVKFLHRRGIIHRDLKPENILFVKENEENVIKLADFGLATHAIKENEEQEHGTFAGTAN